MRAADEVAVRAVGHDTLVERAGLAAALAAVAMLPRVYGARVAVLCGPGDNGADGTVCARHLAARGASVRVVDATDPPARLDGVDLVVDAAFGTGLSRPFTAPETSAPVLALDVPSGVDPDTGAAAGRVMPAVRTVAMAALKRGHVQGPGATLSGVVAVADLGIAVDAPSVALVDEADLDGLPALGRDEHKWRRAVVVVAGSPSMRGAPALVCGGALAAQAGMVQLHVPGLDEAATGPWPTEVVRVGDVDPGPQGLGPLGRAHAVVVGPGVGRSEDAARCVTSVLDNARVPLVLDADALHLVTVEQLAARQARGAAPVVLTPHDGEYAALLGAAPGPDRILAAERAAARTGCTVLLKGPTTVVAAPSGHDDGPRTLVVTAGGPELATPGSGDVLAGVLGALLARGVAPLLAAALAAHVHGLAGAALGARCRAGMLADAIADRLAEGRD